MLPMWSMTDQQTRFGFGHGWLTICRVIDALVQNQFRGLFFAVLSDLWQPETCWSVYSSVLLGKEKSHSYHFTVPYVLIVMGLVHVLRNSYSALCITDGLGNCIPDGLGNCIPDGFGNFIPEELYSRWVGQMYSWWFGQLYSWWAGQLYSLWFW